MQRFKSKKFNNNFTTFFTILFIIYMTIIQNSLKLPIFNTEQPCSGLSCLGDKNRHLALHCLLVQASHIHNTSVRNVLYDLPELQLSEVSGHLVQVSPLHLLILQYTMYSMTLPELQLSEVSGHLVQVSPLHLLILQYTMYSMTLPELQLGEVSGHLMQVRPLHLLTTVEYLSPGRGTIKAIRYLKDNLL